MAKTQTKYKLAFDQNRLDPSLSPPTQGCMANKKPNLSQADKKELDELIRLARKYMWDAPDYHRYIQSKGVIIEPNRFYSERPSIQDIENSFEFRDEYAEAGPFEDPSIFKRQPSKKFMQANMKLAHEFMPPLSDDPENPKGYFWDNPAFNKLDAISYWTMIRAHKPNRIVEIGSGFSSLIAAAALEKNGKGELICIEPYPKPWLSKWLKSGNLIKSPIQDFHIDELNGLLGDGDILFIDSTHTVKIGSDCVYIYLKLLPNINSNILVHVHDIFLPYVRPAERAIEKHVHWTEHYLLMAYLLDNPRTEIQFSSRLAHVYFKKAADRFIQKQFETGGGSFWFTQKARSL